MPFFRHPERSEGSYHHRDSSAFGLRMTAQTEFHNSSTMEDIYRQIPIKRIFLRLFLSRDKHLSAYKDILEKLS